MMSAATLQFPTHAMVGSFGDFATLMAAGTEVPPEFYFAVGLTLLGNNCSGELRLNTAVNAQPRLYTILLGDSYLVKKSTALKRTVEEFFEPLWGGGLESNGPAFTLRPKILWGTGSAEGLAASFNKNGHITLCYDELRALLDKSKVRGSVLLSMVASLFELNNWDNPTKNSSVSVRDAHLSIVGCCTTDTYAAMWSKDALAIGLPNRLFVVLADRSEKVAWPLLPDKAELDKVRERVRQQLGRLPLVLDIEPGAKASWEQWYVALPPTIHTRRLDTIGFRLMGLIALTTDKERIDLETIETVIAILDYELAVRTLTDPIDAANSIARLEQKISRQLQVKGPMNKTALRRSVHADRDGLWALETALLNLRRVGDITFNPSTELYALAPGVSP